MYLVELSGVDAADAAGTLRYCTGEGYVTGPAESPANTVYLPRVRTAGTYSRHLWRRDTTRGRADVGRGIIELANADGALDYLLDWAFDGRQIRILRGEAGAAYASFETVLVGTIERIAVTWDTLTIRIRDRMAEIAEKPLITTRYAGSNVLPDGVEGTPDDIKGQAKPLAIGENENISPVRVNTSKLIYQLSAKAIAEVALFWNGGAAVTPGVQRANLAALLATAPAAGTYDWCLGNDGTGEGAYARLGSTPGSQPVTAYVREGTNAAARTVGQCVKRVLLLAGVAAADVAGVTTLDAVQPAVVGYYAAGEATVGAVVDALCASVGAAWTPRRDGVFTLLRLAAPTGTPVAVLAPWQILGGGQAITLIPTQDSDRGVPAYEVAVRHTRNWTPMSGTSVASGVTDARRDWLGQEYRTATARDTAVWDPDALTGRHPLSKPIEVETLLRTEAAAQAEATRLLALYGTDRLYLSVTVRPEHAAALDLGDVIQIDTARFGLSGRSFLVTGMVEDFRAGTTEIFAWG